MRSILHAVIFVLAALPLATGAFAETTSASKRSVRLDLADLTAGTYQGDVISDARGSSRSNVTITVVKVARNQVRVTSNYNRLPPFTVSLTRAMHTIQQASGDNVFLVDQSKTPWSLDVTVDDASWSGTKH